MTGGAEADALAIWDRIIAQFVASKRRQRMRYMLESPKRRDLVVDELNSPALFDERCLHELDAGTRDASAIADALARRGAGARCVRFRRLGDHAGERAALPEALEATLGCGDDVLIFCPDGNVGLYEWHHGDRFLLYR